MDITDVDLNSRYDRQRLCEELYDDFLRMISDYGEGTRFADLPASTRDAFSKAMDEFVFEPMTNSLKDAKESSAPKCKESDDDACKESTKSRLRLCYVCGKAAVSEAGNLCEDCE